MNTVLWNTIQLLFPEEIASRKFSSSPVNSAGKTAGNSCGSNNARLRRFLRRPTREGRSEIEDLSIARNQSEDAALALRLQREEMMAGNSSGSGNARSNGILRRPIREGTTETGEISRERNQSEDAALALRLQREEMMAGFRANRLPMERNTVYVARANLRAMASRAVQLRSRRRQC